MSCGSRTTRPTRRTPSRTGSCRSRSPARRSSASRRSRAHRRATSPTRSRRTRRPRAWSPTCSSRPTSRSRRFSPPACTARTSSSVRGNYDDVNRLCTELSGEHDWAFVNINMRPYYAEGSKTLAFEIAEQLGFELPDRLVCPIASGSLFTKIARGFEEWIDLGLLAGTFPIFNGAQADRLLSRRDGVRGRPGAVPPGEARHDREVTGDRQPGRRPVRPRPRAPYAVGRSTASATTRSAPASACSPPRPGSSPRRPGA